MMIIHKNRYRWPGVRLGPIQEMIRSKTGGNMDLEDMATRLHMTKASVSALMMKDDTTLSRVKYIANCYGCELDLVFPPYRALGLAHPSRAFERAGILEGLGNYLMQRYGSILEASKHIPCCRSTLEKALGTGDMRISILIEICNSLGIVVEWNFIELA